MNHQNAGDRILSIIIFVFMTVITILTLYPFIYIASVSISSPSAVLENKVTLLPVGFNLNAYKEVFKNPYIWISYGNTIKYTIVSVVVQMFMTIITAYPLSRSRFPGKGFFMKMVVFTMLFSGGMVPSFILVQKLGLYNSIWALILPSAFSTWNLIILRTFFMSIPESLDESAQIDGAGDVTILFKIILPTSVPILMTIGLFYAIWQWNSFFPPLIYLSDKSKYPLQIILRQLIVDEAINSNNNASVTEAVVSQAVKSATIMAATLPIICIYPFVQKYFVKGVMMGAVKG